MAEFGIAGTDLFFCANCSASLKTKETRYPSVRISHEGAIAILEGSCVCPAQADGRFAHVATLLYLVEDLSFKNVPKLPQPTTDVLQYWGKGKKRGRLSL